jgi:hypothetical protein
MSADYGSLAFFLSTKCTCNGMGNADRAARVTLRVIHVT